jgi:L-arabinose isomerase
MIIKTDLRNISVINAPVNRKSAVISGLVKNRQPDTLTHEALTDRLRIERSLGDALSIVQMSQNVIQRAISVSTQLKNIASNAIASGKVNTQALNEAISEMKSTVSTYGEQVSNPVQMYTIPSAKIVEMPDLRSEMKSIRDITMNLENKNYSQAGRIESVNAALSDKLNAFRAAEDKITALMRDMATGSAPYIRTHSVELASLVKSVIVANPESALAAQGNINYNAAGRLIM